VVADKSDNESSPQPVLKITTEYRSGYYEQEVITSNKGERHEKLVRHPKNPAKVVIGSIGNITYDVYPYDFPDKVFIHASGEKHFIDKYDSAKMISINNKIKWFLNGGLESALSGKSKSSLAREIRLAYEYKKIQVIGV
jgi:hypothetical protein